MSTRPPDNRMSNTTETKSLAFIGTTGRVAGGSFLDTGELLSRVGANTGNLVFQYAVANSIRDRTEVIGIDLPWNPAQVRERCRALVVPAANFVRENFDLSGFVDFIDKTQLPVVMLGLGAQADSYEKKSFDLHPSIHRLLALLRDRAALVGVRGPFTAEVLSSLGVHNTKVIGCPSNFLNPDEDLPQHLARKWEQEPEVVATTGDEPWPKNPQKRDAERRLIEMTLAHGGVYVQQSVDPFVRALRNRNPYQTQDVQPDLIDSLRRSLAPMLSLREFQGFLASRVRLYLDVDQWLEDAARFSLSIGLRLHGNMVPFQSGCPAVWVHHDARTKELAETMALPQLSLDDFLAAGSLAEIRQRVDFDMGRYAATRRTLRQAYCEVLERAGIAHRWA